MHVMTGFEMSVRNRKRRQDRKLLNTEFIAVSAPREVNPSLPFESVRVRPDYKSQSLDRQFGDMPRIDKEKIVQDLRAQHIRHDLANNQTPNYHRYDYKRIKIGRDEKVLLPSSHPICKEREERREVLFARHKTGKKGQNAPILPRLIVKCDKRRK